MIRLMEIADIQEVLTIEQAVFPTPWKEQDFLFELSANPFARYYVLEEDGEIIGFIGAWLQDDQAQITNVAVRPERQEHGYGKQILQYMLSLPIKTWTLEVRVSNDRAIALYEKAGFRKVTLRKNYYTDTHEDAYLMMKGED